MFAAPLSLHQFCKAYSKGLPEPPVMKRRGIHGGPWDGRGITVPEHLTTLECGWMSGQYQLENGAFEFRWHTHCPKA